MNNNMKCPICGNDLGQYNTGFVCYRHCLNGKNVWGSEETLKELDRTRKALEIAVDALDTFARIPQPIAEVAKVKLYAIKALEQKDKNNDTEAD